VGILGTGLRKSLSIYNTFTRWRAFFAHTTLSVLSAVNELLSTWYAEGWATMSVPIIDLSKALNGATPAQRAQVLMELRHALLNIGFLYLVNHSVPASTVSDLLGILPPLFTLPEEAKQEVALVKSPAFLGYSSFGGETTAGKQDQREQFEFANEGPPFQKGGQEDPPLHTKLLGRNQWPGVDDVSQLTLAHGSQLPREKVKMVVERYIEALQDLSEQFLGLVEEALELDTGILQGFTHAQDRLKLVHYRSESQQSTQDDGPQSNGQTTVAVTNGTYIQGVGPHKDSSGWMTFLLQTQPVLSPESKKPALTGKGLQVLTKSGEWLDVPPIPGSFVVNMGQAFEVVTNGLCKATTHRVLLPLTQEGYDRYSVPFFQGVRPERTKADFRSLWGTFESRRQKWALAKGEEGLVGKESAEAQSVDSPFLKGRYDTWGEAQLRTKIRSHRDVGRRWYPDVFDRYLHDDA
jgi:isopenicillin N synthase-like dioxygenase